MAKILKVIDDWKSISADARESLLLFTQQTKPRYRTNWHHAELAKQLDRVAQGKCRRLMVFMPPQHGKSELVSRRFPAFMLGRNPDLRLIACSHTHDLAVSMNRDVQRIMTSPAYEEIFRKFKLSRRRVGAGGRTEARRTMDCFEIPGHAGSLRSAGVGNSIAGLPADGAIIDDPFGKREDADSPVVRQRVWDWYTNDLYPRLSTDAWIVLTHTRWHRDDLAGRLLRKMADRKADQLVFCDEKRPDMVGIEAEQFQELLVHEFRRQCGGTINNTPWPLYKMMTGGMPKIARIRRLSQYVINRELRFKADSPGCRLLVDQLMDFPLAAHDDGPDALEMCTRLPVEVVL